IEHTGDYQCHAALLRQWQKLFFGNLIEQRVAASQKRAIEISLFQRIANDLPFVHTKTKALDITCRAQFGQRTETTAPGQRVPVKLVPVGMGHAANVVNIEKIDFRKAETLLAVIEAAHD